MTKTKTKTQTKCLKTPTYAIFLKSWWLTHSKYDDRYLTLVILFMLVTLVTLFRSYNQFYRTVSGFLFDDDDRQVSLTNQHAQVPDEPEGRAALLCHPPLPQGGQKSWHNRFIEDGHNHTFGLEFFVSGTFKIRKLDLVREGYNPQLVSLEKFSHRCILIVVLFSGKRSSLLLQQFERGLLQARLLPLWRDHQHALPPLVTRSSAKDTLVWF